MRKRRFVIRTIKNGQVKINGRIYEPSSRWLEYDGRLDGQRWAFGLYWTGDEQLTMAALWGTEAAYLASYEDKTWEAYIKVHPRSPAMEQGEDGVLYYPWATWYTEST